MSEGNDINIGSIEEGIKILEELMQNVELTFSGWVGVLNERQKKALKNLIQDYTRQKQINEEHQKINGELREKVKELERNSNCDSVYAIKFATMQQQINEKDKRIQELEEERQLVGIPVRNKRDGKIGIVLHQWENGSIAVLERINPRIINTHDSWNTLEIITDEVKQIQTKDDSIPKQKVKDKIEEIKEDKESKYFDTFLMARDINYAIDILEELLEDK